MKLPDPFVQLPLLFDAAALAAEIEAIPESCWKPHPEGFIGNSMLPLVAVGGDPDNEGFSGAMRPTPYLLSCPYMMQALDSLGIVLGRTRLMRLSGHAEVVLHADRGYYWAERVRVHVPIVTQPAVRFYCGDADVHMAAGEAWIFDTWRLHRVINDDTRSRVHLVADTVGGERFWDMVAAGRSHDGPFLQSPQRILPAAGPEPELAYELVNTPLVMSPWELRSMFELLFVDAIPHPQLATMQQLTRRFCNLWQALWAQYGDGPEGRPHFRKALDHFVERVRLVGEPIKLRNELTLVKAFMTLVAQRAVADGTRRVPQSEYAADIADRA